MKRIINIKAIILSITLLFASINMAKASTDIIIDNDTTSFVSKIIRKPLFDRGVSNYRFIAKGSILGGITFNYFSFDSKDSKFLFGMLDNVNYNASMLGFSPYFAYSIAENQIIGLRANYSRVDGSLGNFSLNFGDFDMSIQDLSYKQSSYGMALFYRSYVGLEPSHRFGLFSEVSLSYKMGNSLFDRGRDSELKSFHTTIHAFDIGMSPGIAVFIAQNASMEVSFNVVGFNYRKENQTLNKEENGSFENSGIDFRINPFNINIGLTVTI